MKSIVTVTSASNTYELTVIDTVKAELGVTGSAEDNNLYRWIAQASSIAASYCNRVFAKETVSEAFRPNRDVAFRQSRRTTELLALSRRPVVSITSVTVDDVALTTSDYECDPETGQLFRLDESGCRSRWAASKAIVVVYVGGYDLLETLPFDVESAVILMVRMLREARKRDPMITEESIPGVLTSRWSSDPPAEVAALLGRYRAIEV